jgi:hypothetical protein
MMLPGGSPAIAELMLVYGQPDAHTVFVARAELALAKQPAMTAQTVTIPVVLLMIASVLSDPLLRRGWWSLKPERPRRCKQRNPTSAQLPAHR